MLLPFARLCLALLVACPISLRVAHAEVAGGCMTDAAFTAPDTPLEHVGAAIAAGGPVAVLAVGSATTVGDELGRDHKGAFPYFMLDALQAALPKVTFTLSVRGGHGMTAQDMLPLLETALSTRHYDLVLWQTGTVEAVHGDPPDGMAAALQEGVEQARASGADVVLIDPQFSRFLRANTDLDPYEEALQEVAVMPGVALFHRYDMMQGWAESGEIDLERARRIDRGKLKVLLNTCVGEALARFVLNGTHVAP